VSNNHKYKKLKNKQEKKKKKTKTDIEFLNADKMTISQNDD